MKLGARDAARLLAITESELYRLVDAGAIPCHLVNKQPLFGHAELLEWATSEGRPLSPAAVFADPARRADLSSAILAGGVHHDVPGTDVESVLRSVVERLPITDAEDREMVLAVLRAREAEVSTGIGNGIAIPHVRTPLVFPGPAGIVVCFLANFVPFAAIDDEPIHTVFAMVTPTIDGHLELLSRLAIALHDTKFKDAITRRASLDEIVGAARRIEAEAATT